MEEDTKKWDGYFEGKEKKWLKDNKHRRTCPMSKDSSDRLDCNCDYPDKWAMFFEKTKKEYENNK